MIFEEKRKMLNRGAGPRITAAILSGVLILTLCACSLLPEEEEFRSAPTVAGYSGASFVTAACMKADVEVTSSVSLNYVAIRTEDLTFGISGQSYDEVYVSVGDNVHAGDVLAELSMDDLESRIDTVSLSLEKLALSLTQNEESRALELKGAEISSQYLSAEDRAEAAAEVNARYDSIKRDLEDQQYIARLRLEDYEAQKASRQIVAPFDGTVTYAYGFSVSDVSDISKTVITLADSSMSLFRGKTPDWESFVSGTEVTVSVGNTDYEAVITTEEELGIEQTEHVSGERGYVYLVLKETAYDIKDNASGKAVIVTDASRDCLSVPIKAVTRINGETVVYIPDENGLKTYRKVETGLEGDSRVEILSGLEEGERVVIN